MILPIYLYGQPVLRKEAEEVAPDYPDLKKLVADMYETMHESDGCGLAAPQVGLSIRLVVIDADVLKDTYPELEGVRLTLVNPELDVLEDGQKVTRSEGCLSLPGLGEPVSRYEKVRPKKCLRAFWLALFSMSVTIWRECSILIIYHRFASSL